MLHSVEYGVQNPTNLRLMQLPRYYVEKFAFSHQRTVVNGNPIVVRELRDEYRNVVRKVHELSYRSKIQALNDFILNINLNQLQKYDYSFSDLKLIRSYSRNTEFLFCQHFVNNLSPKARSYFYFKGYRPVWMMSCHVVLTFIIWLLMILTITSIKMIKLSVSLKSLIMWYFLNVMPLTS